MAAKTKLSPEDIVGAALEVIRQQGEEKFSAREVAKKLGCSTQPIIYNFTNMETLKQATLCEADRFHTEYIVRHLQEKGGSIQQLALSHIEFARDEQNLFRFLFLNGRHNQMKDNKPQLLSSQEGNAFTEMTAKITGLRLEYATRLFTSMWWMVHGIATMVATDMCYYSNEQIIQQLRITFHALKNHLRQQEMLTENRQKEKPDLPRLK